MVFHNCLFGFFAGFLFLAPMKECHLYRPKEKLLVNSIILAGTGFGSVVFGAMNVVCMNPEAFDPNIKGFFAGDLDYIARKFPSCIQQMSLNLLCMGVGGIVLMVPLIIHNYRIRMSQTNLAQEQRDYEFSCYTEE